MGKNKKEKQREEKKEEKKIKTSKGSIVETELKQKIEELENKIEELKKENEKLTDQKLRILADYNNYKKRVEKEIEDIRKFANEKLIKDLLEVLDNIDRLYASLDEELFKDNKFKAFVDGVKMITNSLHKILANYGLEKYTAVGERFDPYYHEALMEQETEEHETGTILNEYQPGYILNGKVIRHAKVVVARKKENSEESSQQQES